MPVEAWDYYINYIAADNNPERNGFIFRHHPSDPIEEGQIYAAKGEWIRSTSLLDLSYGHDDYELMPVTEERARQLMDQWVQAGRFSKAPDDWQ